jgi:cytochrome P450 family 135
MAAASALPPGPRTPGALQTLRYSFDPYGLFESGQRAFGDVFTVQVMGESWVVLAHPEAVREVFAHGPDELDSGAANFALRPLLGTRNLLLLDGPEHLRRRKLVLPPFHGERMRAYEELIRETTRREIAAWPLEATARTLPRMQAITFRVVLRAVFGVAEGPGLDRMAAILRRFLAWTTDPRRGLFFAFLGPERFMGLSAYRRQREELDRELLAEIAQRRRVDDLGERTDILSLLLQARDEDGAPLSDGELRDELVTLLVAGHETTAAALSWALVELARHPPVQDRLADGEEGLAAAAVDETLRLHPPVPLGGVRRLRVPLTIAGFDMPAGASVTPCALLVHRRPDVYPEPLAWRVDRFLGKRPPAGAWIPFGGGVRRCVGAAFAQFEARTVLDELVGALEFRPAAPPTRRIWRRGVVLVPMWGGPVVASRRRAAARSAPDRAEAAGAPASA